MCVCVCVFQNMHKHHVFKLQKYDSVWAGDTLINSSEQANQETKQQAD